MITKTYTVTTTECTRAQIWQLMADVDNWSKWDDTVERAELNGDFKKGSTFVLRPKGGPNVNIRLAEVQPMHYFKDLTTFPLAKMYGEHWYEDTPQGLKITVTMTMTGMLSFLWNKIVMSNIVAGFERDIANQVAAAKTL